MTQEEELHLQAAGYANRRKEAYIEKIRVRIMSEAYDLADRGDFEGYNAVKVMCGEVLESIAAVVTAEREACAQEADAHASIEGIAQRIATSIRARGQA
jgi:hypothetical protein